MASPFYSWLVNKIRTARYSVGNNIATNLYTFGGIYEGTYTGIPGISIIHDRFPLIWIMMSNNQYTDGINLHYLDRNELAWFGRNIYMIKKYQQAIDGRVFYQFLKQQKPSIVNKAYRKYFTSKCSFRLVSAGITNMDDLTYSSRNPFIAELNRMLSPEVMNKVPTKASYSTEELRERIIEAQNTRNIYTQKVQSTVYGNAPFIK